MPTPTPGTATEQDLLRARQCELVDGTLIGKTGSFWKGALEASIGCRLHNQAHIGNRAAVTMGSGPHRLAAGIVRLPDVAVTLWNRLLNTDGTIPDIAPAAPDLVVEIPVVGWNPPSELARKRREFFAAGTRILWEVSIEERSALVYTTPEVGRFVGPDEPLDCGTILPNFCIQLSEVFTDFVQPEPSPDERRA